MRKKRLVWLLIGIAIISLIAACGGGGGGGASAGIVTTQSTGLVTTEYEDTATFWVYLNTAPSNTVTINVTSFDLTEATVSPATLTFTPEDSDMQQLVTITGVDDDLIDGNQTVSVTLNAIASLDTIYSAVSIVTLSVINSDNESAGITVSETSVTTGEDSSTDSFTVQPNIQPTLGDDLIVAVTSVNTDEATVSPAILTFTYNDWSAQTVTVTGVDDDLVDGNKNFNITFDLSTSSNPGYHYLAAETVSVTNLDDEAAGTPGITVSKTSVSVSEDETTDTFTVVPDTQPASGLSVVVAVTSDDEGEATVSPATLTFTNSDWTAKTVTVTGVDDSPVFDLDQTFLLVLNTSTSTDTDYNVFEKTVDVTNLSVDVTEGRSTQPLDLDGLMSYAGSVDAMTMSFYVFPVTQGTKYTIMIEGHTQNASLYAYNSDSTFTDVACSSTVDANPKSCQVVADGDLMYVRISGWSVSTTTDFLLHADVPTTYYIQTLSNGASLAATDTYLTLYDSNRVAVLASNDDKAVGKYSELSYGLVSGRTYYIKVEDWLNKGGGYAIRASASDTVVTSSIIPNSPDIYENDDTLATAEFLGLDSLQNHTFDGVMDTDWLRFTAP